MSQSKTINVRIPGSISFATVLLLVGLKLTGNLSVSWLWVFSPLWAPPMIFVLLWIIFVVWCLIQAAYVDLFDRR